MALLSARQIKNRLPVEKLFIEGIMNDEEFVPDVREVKLQ
jgi:hypothetical protein